MTTTRRFDFKQLDVFSEASLKGNPLAVVLGADGISEERMATFANWTNLSETTFVLAPQHPEADYRVRIFTTSTELPFAGHPTLGSCHAWLEAGGVPKRQEIVQECGVGLVRIRRSDYGLAFLAPPLLKSGPLEVDVLERVRKGLGLPAEAIVDAQWVDNGAGWLALLLKDRQQVLTLKPDYYQLRDLAVGVVAPWDPVVDGDAAQFEVRGFIAGDGMPEDPSTGSLNAGLAQWMLSKGLAPSAYVVSQGVTMGRAGRIHVERIGDEVWIGGAVVTCINGVLTL
ncbi:PhzF family phenazine biosynthesis protein [Pseudomonas sp. H2_D02]